MGFLSVLLDMMSEGPPHVTTVPARCLRSRLNTSECRLCLDVCGPAALSLVEGHIAIDPDRCTACMSCSAVCPNDALDGHYDLLSLLEAISSTPQVVVSCNRTSTPSRAEVVVPCIGIFSAESLLALGRSRSDGVTFDLGGCESCTNHHASVRFRARLERLRDWASDLPTRLIVDGGQDRSNDIAPADRRAFLTNVFAGLSSASSIGLSQGSVADRTPGGRIGAKRIPTKVRILEKVITSVDEEARGRLIDLCCFRLIINDRCTSCRRCTAICPTGAIRLQRMQSIGQIQFTAVHCSGCGLCISFCKEKALELKPPRWATEKLVDSLLFDQPGQTL